MRFKNINDFESYIEKIDEKYDGGDVVFEGDAFQLPQLDFKPLKRSNYGRASNHLYNIQEYFGTNCYILTGNNCFVKCINYLTGNDYTQQYLDFISEGDRRKNVMTLARIQPFVKKNGIEIEYFNGKEVLPRSVKERKKCLYLHNNHFCCIWGDSLKKAVEELQVNFKLVNNFVNCYFVNKYVEYNFKPNTIESQLNNVCVYDIETYNKDRAVPYAIGFYPVSQLASKWNRDLTQDEIDKCLNDARLFEGENCITE